MSTSMSTLLSIMILCDQSLCTLAVSPSVFLFPEFEFCVKLCSGDLLLLLAPPWFERLPRLAFVTLPIGCMASVASKAARNDLTHGIEAELMDQASTTCVQIAAVEMFLDGGPGSSPLSNSMRLVVAAATESKR